MIKKLLTATGITLCCTLPLQASQDFNRSYFGYRITHAKSRYALYIPGLPTNYKGLTLYPKGWRDYEQGFNLFKRDPNWLSKNLPYHTITFMVYTNPGQPDCLNLTYPRYFTKATSYDCIYDRDGLQNWRLAPTGRANYFMLQSANRHNSVLCLEPNRSINYYPNIPVITKKCDFRNSNQYWYLEKFEG